MTIPIRTAKEIFVELVAHVAPDLWDAELDRMCQGDRKLRQRVQALLSAHSKPGSFMAQPAVAADTMATEEPPDGRPLGTFVGPYKLLQQIGEGGMGTVYMAEQTHPVQRRVALKVIKPGMDSRQVIARFEAERQALAMMDHVNIARVLDAGTVFEPEGLNRAADVIGGLPQKRMADDPGFARPYFVMELVHGVPITQYCDDNQLTLRQRLELFIPVCQAIQHAHQKGIIHRDIKPTNVMITMYDGKPVPKVIDFGVAKAMERTLTQRTMFTQYGTMVGTLEYMSPEQAEMSALGTDTRSDIQAADRTAFDEAGDHRQIRNNRGVHQHRFIQHQGLQCHRHVVVTCAGIVGKVLAAEGLRDFARRLRNRNVRFSGRRGRGRRRRGIREYHVCGGSHSGLSVQLAPLAVA